TSAPATAATASSSVSRNCNEFRRRHISGNPAWAWRGSTACRIVRRLRAAHRRLAVLPGAPGAHHRVLVVRARRRRLLLPGLARFLELERRGLGLVGVHGVIARSGDT